MSKIYLINKRETMKKNTLIKLSILSTILLFNSGCVSKLFKDTPKVIKTQKVTPIPNITTPNFENIATECSDDINKVSACNKGLVKATELKPKVVTQIGEIHKLKSFQGEDITIVERKNGYIFPQFKNKTVILEMFGKNCSHCIKEISIMNSLRHRYRNKLEIIAIQVEEEMSPFQAKAFIRRHHIKYPVISGETATNLQYNVQNTYGWTGILPFIMVIKNGVTEFSYRGEVSNKELNRDIKSIL